MGIFFNDLIKWWSIGYEIVGHIEDGKGNHQRLNTMLNTMPPKEVIVYLKSLLEGFVLQNFLAKWQNV